MEDLTKKSILIMLICILIISCYSPSIFAISVTKEKDELPLGTIQNDKYDYLIITDDDLVGSKFQFLILHKSQYVTAKIVSLDEIEYNPDYWVFGKYGDGTSQSDGNPFVEDGKEATSSFHRFNDTAARIRNFIRFAYSEWQTRYVLLGGDTELIPARPLRVDDAYWYSGVGYEILDANINSDLYYGALYGTYNDDCDQYFGEDSDHSIREEADFTSEVYIGRAPVNDKSEVSVFVDKVIHYETNYKPNNIQLHQAGINQINQPDSSVIPEACDQLIPPNYDVYKLYSINERVTIDKYVNAFRTPSKSLFLHIGSGNNLFYYTYRAIADDIPFTTYDVNLLDNTFYPVHISISCNSGNFGHTEDCLAEKLLLWDYGGPSACIFNTHYGFVSHLSALDYSGEFIVKQFYEIFQNGTKNLGKIVTYSKDPFVNQAYTDEGYRWCIYTINLLGDPETPMFDKRDEIQLYDEVFIDDDYDSSTPGWGEDHFDNIQTGINAVNESGYVYVNKGVYYENIFIGKTLNLIGEEKETTIIKGTAGQNTITISTDSAYVEGFTITHDNTLSGMGDSGVVINEYGNGIEVCNNIIDNNREYGVLIIGSCHHNIHHNDITSNFIGIGLWNPGDITINPCDNLVSNNLIKDSDSLGVYAYFAGNNHIRCNIFENNCKEENIPGINPNAFFITEPKRRNEWNGNDWDHTNKRIVPIYGRIGTIDEFTGDINQDINLGRLGIEFDFSSKSRSRDFGLLQLIEIILSKFLKFYNNQPLMI